MENAAATNVEEFDEYEGDADLDEGAEAQETEPEEGETNNEAAGAESAAEGETGEKDAEPAKPQKTGGKDKSAGEEKPWKTEENARAAQVRRERERKEIEERAYRKGIVDSVGGVNPYTNEKIEDEADINEFLAMREIEKSGGDPIQDYASFTKTKAKEQAQKASEQSKEADQKKWFEKDYTDFQTAHPGVDFAKLLADDTFRIFSDGKIGNQPMTKIYDDFLKVSGKYQADARKTAQRIAAKAKASPGSLTGGEPQTLSYGNMSDDEFEKMIQKAKRGELSKH